MFLIQLTLIIFNLLNTSIQQTPSKTKIDEICKSIETSKELTTKAFDAVEVYNEAYEGGGVITIKYNQSGLKMVKEELGMSFGRVTNCIYMKAGTPVKVVEIEENFAFREDQTGWDYSKINQVFKATYWVYNWEMDNMESAIEGKRQLSSPCSVFEHIPLIELGEKLMTQ